MPRVLRFKPPAPLCLDGYDLDAFALEGDDETAALDFRFELGRGLGIFWALPAGPNERLRLFHVDGAAYEVDEPVLVKDPWTCDLPQLHWPGNRAELGQGRRLVSVTVDALAQPASWRCELVVEQPDGGTQATVLSWSAAK